MDRKRLLDSVLGSRDILSPFSALGKGGLIASCAIVCLLACIVVPLPRALLDLLLVSNILLALIVLLRGLAVTDPVKIYSFPAILLLATLFRLALNVSSTRLILSEGHLGIGAAGDVIQAFGSFVVRGDFFVGVIIFAVIAVVNFVVIAKGSARVAEVAARFVLDALPGRQLAIDADLRSGNITREVAEERRNHLAQESQFFGAMDGAMKFVQGDAIAGMVIVAINAFGGVGIGKSRGMEIIEAINTFGVLTIGEGLVNIIPSLLMSLAAGIIVTHVSGSTKELSVSTGSAVISQLVGDRQVLLLSGSALLLFGLLPGMPFVPFALVAAAVLGGARFLLPASSESDGQWESLPPGSARPAALRSGAGSAPTKGLVGSSDLSDRVLLEWDGKKGDVQLLNDVANSETSEVTPLLLEVDSIGLVPYLASLDKVSGASSFATLFTEIAGRHCLERGIPCPQLTVRANKSLERGGYRIHVREQFVNQGRIDESQLLVGVGANIVSLFGCAPIRTVRFPVDGRSSTWIRTGNNHPRVEQAALRSLKRLGVSIISPAECLVREILSAILQNAAELLGLEEVKASVTRLKERAPNLVEEIFDKGVVGYAEFAEILRRLARDRIPVRDLKRLVEGIAEFSALESETEDRQVWINQVHEFLRASVLRSAMSSIVGPSGKLRVFLLNSEVEEEFRSAQSDSDNPRMRLSLEPRFESGLRESAKRMFQPVIDRGNTPVVVLCAADVRAAVQEFLHRNLTSGEWLRTLSPQEIDSVGVPESVGVLGVM